MEDAYGRAGHRRPGTERQNDDEGGLVDAGTRLILEQGYHQTGIQDVLQAAGVPKGSFYYYFPSKEAFGQAVIAQFAAAYLARLEQYLRDTTASPLTACVATTKTCSPGLSAVGAGVPDRQSQSGTGGSQPPLAGPAGRGVDQLARAVCAAVS